MRNETEEIIGLNMTYKEITAALKRRERKVKARREKERMEQAVYSLKEYYKVKINYNGRTKTFWSKGKSTKKGMTFYFECAKDGHRFERVQGDKIIIETRIVVSFPDDVIWEKPARLNEREGELEIVRGTK